MKITHISLHKGGHEFLDVKNWAISGALLLMMSATKFPCYASNQRLKTYKFDLFDKVNFLLKLL